MEKEETITKSAEGNDGTKVSSFLHGKKEFSHDAEADHVSVGGERECETCGMTSQDVEINNGNGDTQNQGIKSSIISIL